MKEITLHNRYTLAEVGKAEVMNEPVIHEEINGGYTLNIALDYRKKSLLHKNALLLVDGQYFQISTQASEHSSNSLSVSLNCEHINYELLEDEDYQEEYEDTAYGMLSAILSDTRFKLGNVMSTGVQYYKPSAETVRNRLLDVANLFEGELIYDNFTVHMVPDRRGTLESIKVELGVNQISIRENINYIEGEVSYEIDCVDLSQIPGYEQFSKISLGDTVEMNNKLLNIEVKERVIAYSYNPFKRQTLSCTVGNYVNDFTKYVKEEEEEKEKEEDGLLAVFRIGDVNALPVMSDERNAVLDYITDTSLQGIIPGADVEVTANKKGVSAALKSGLNHHLTAMITTETEEGIMASFAPVPSADLTNLVLPGNNVSVSVVMIITTVPFADLASGLVPVEGDPEDEEFVSPLIGAYGIRVLINDNADGFLDNFKIGDVDVLRLDKTDATDVVIDYIKGNRAQPITPTVYEVTEGKLKGIYASLKGNYKNHHLTFLYATKDEEGDWGVEKRKIPFTNARIFTTPRAKDDSVIMVITKEPYESITASNVDSSFIKAFGVRIQMAKEIFLDEFKIGDIDMLFADGLEIENDNLASIKAEVDYTKADEFTGLFLKLKKTYSDYAISVREYTAKGSTSAAYTDAYKTKKYPNNLVAITVTVSKDYEKQIYGFKFKKGEGVPGDIDWLSEFRIGNVDMLPIASDERQQVLNYFESAITGTPPSDVVASAIYETEEDLTGLFAQLQAKYANGTLMIFEYYLHDDGTVEYFPGAWAALQGSNPSNWTIPGDSKKVSFTFALFDLPMEELTPDKFISSFVGAYGVSVVKKEKQPDDRKGVRFATVMGYRLNGSSGYGAVELQLIFEDENESDGEWYTLLNPASDSYFLQSFRGERVMVIDGIVMGKLMYSNRT